MTTQDKRWTAGFRPYMTENVIGTGDTLVKLHFVRVYGTYWEYMHRLEQIQKSPCILCLAGEDYEEAVIDEEKEIFFSDLNGKQVSYVWHMNCYQGTVLEDVAKRLYEGKRHYEIHDYQGFIRLLK